MYLFYAKLAVVEIQKLASTKVFFTKQTYWSIRSLKVSICNINTAGLVNIKHKKDANIVCVIKMSRLLWKNKGDSLVQTQHLEEPTVAEL